MLACPSGQGTLLHASMPYYYSRSTWKVAMVEFLIEKGVDIYAVHDVKEETALHVAIVFASLEIV
jgi:ankyrin repeat protein